jgi:hypothetical protein
MTIRHIGEKTPEWEVEDLGNGRWALKRKGLVVCVRRTQEELTDWLRTKQTAEATGTDPEALGRAVRRLS